MNTKLTLKLDSKVIDRAKSYAASHKRSLSALVGSYLQSLTEHDPGIAGDPSSGIADMPISPFVRSMATDSHISTDLDDQQAYSDYLADKYR